MIQTNDNAFEPRTLQYRALRTGLIKRHNWVYHKYPDDTPAIHIPVELEGVVA